MNSIQGTSNQRAYQAYSQGTTGSLAASSAEPTSSVLENSQDDIMDIVDIGASGAENSEKTYTRDSVTIDSLNAIKDNNLRMLQDMVRKLISKQSGAAQELLSLDIDELTRAEASEMISEDGPLGVKAVSENLLNFAKAISGGDPSKIEELREATKKGFEQVASMFGGWDNLPDITKDTFETTMKGFDDWAAEFAQ